MIKILISTLLVLSIFASEAPLKGSKEFAALTEVIYNLYFLTNF